MSYNNKDHKKNETLRIKKDSETQNGSHHRLPVHTTKKKNGSSLQRTILEKHVATSDSKSPLSIVKAYTGNKYENLRQGDIVYIDLGQGEGSEERGLHPCYVLLNNLGILHGPILVVAPISSKIKKLPTHYTIHDYEKYGLEKVSQILFEQQRTIDKSRVKIAYGVIGHIDFEVIMNELFMIYGFSVKTEKKEGNSNELCICRSIC